MFSRVLATALVFIIRMCSMLVVKDSNMSHITLDIRNLTYTTRQGSQVSCLA